VTGRGRRTRDKIVAAAAELMHRNGVRATSLDDVLAHCGAGKSQLYQHFASKDELMQAVVTHQWRVTRAAFNLDSHGPDTWSDVRRWINTVIDIQLSADAPVRCPLGSLAYELTSGNEAVRAQLDQIFTEWAAHLADGLSRMKSRNMVRNSADPHRLALATLASFQGGIMLAHTHGDLDPLRAALDGAFDMLRSYAV
jgi:AcrR family transcriptional regulator